MNIICPLGFDLARDTDGIIRVGQGTKLSCDRAIEIARLDPENSIIIVTAGKAGPGWSGVIMSNVMASYIKISSPLITIHEACAQTFNTFGEMKTLAELVSRMTGVHVTLAVKDWHAPRAKFLLQFWLWKYGCHHPVSVSTYPQPVPTKILLEEYFGSWPKNLLRVARCLFKKAC